MNISLEDTKLTNREGSSDRREKGTEFEKIGDEENVQNYIYIYIYNNMTYLCTTWLGHWGNYTMMFSIVPFPHGLWLRMTAWENGAKTQKLYTITNESQGVWGPGRPGTLPLSAPSSPAYSYSISTTARDLSSPSGQEHIHRPFPDIHINKWQTC